MENRDFCRVNEVRLLESGLEWTGYSDHQWSNAVDAMAMRMARLGTPGARFLLAFGRNTLLDLLVRQAAHQLGFVPVTMNWQADTPEIFSYKMNKTQAQFVVVHESCPSAIRGLIDEEGFEPAVFSVTEDMLKGSVTQSHAANCSDTNTALTLFTSGTTGTPKGVELSVQAYEANLNIFHSFLDLKEDEAIRVVLVNPLHHANSSSMSSFALKHSGAQLYLCSHYGTAYWDALAEIAKGFSGRIVAPLVARHFEYLENLLNEGRLVLSQEHRDALARTEFLVGSAPVGPQTVERFKKLTGRLPKVRFGSTELCLQALGIDSHMSEASVLRAFERGWTHTHEEEAMVGYYIGRPHAPLTLADVVESVVPEEPGFMKPVEPGAPGFLVVKSASQMTGYVDEPDATRAVLHEGWYLGLGDVVFYLTNEDTGVNDYYWVSRSAGLMIRGGANYSCVQLEAELMDFAMKHLGWVDGSFDLAVVGHKLGSEHEDSCCVLLELGGFNHEEAMAMVEEFKREAVLKVSKGAKPDHVKLGTVPRNFKGATVRPKVREYFESLQ